MTSSWLQCNMTLVIKKHVVVKFFNKLLPLHGVRANIVP